MGTPFKMKGWSPFHQEEKKMKVTPGEKVKPKYTLKVGNLPNGNKEYFKVDKNGKKCKAGVKVYAYVITD